MNSILDEIDKLYDEFKDEISFIEFKRMCFRVHAHHTKQYTMLLFGKQNKKHDIVQVYSRHIEFHVRRALKNGELS